MPNFSGNILILGKNWQARVRFTTFMHNIEKWPNSVQCNYFNETPPLNFKLLKARREQIFRLKKAVKIRFFDFFFRRPIDNKCQNAICILATS